MYALPSSQELTKNVSEANNKASGFNNIDKSGKYLLKIDAAEWFTSNGGAKGIRFHLTSDTEKTAKVELYYAKKDGSRNDFSANKLDALMVVCGVRNLTDEKDTVMKWNKESKSMVETDIMGAPELKDKWFTGLIQIEKDAYDAGNGIKEIDKYNFYGIFQKDTELSAFEIMKKITQPAEISECMDGLEGYMVKYTDNYTYLLGGEKKESSGGYSSTQRPNTSNYLDDDLPF